MSAIQRVGGALRRRADRLRHGTKCSAEPWQSGPGLLVMRLTRLDPAAPRT